jgi:hypothetical protein
VPLRTPDQPYVRIGLIAEANCDFARRLVRAVAPRIESLQLPVHDAVADYPAAPAERDPREAMSVVDVDDWDIARRCYQNSAISAAPNPYFETARIARISWFWAPGPAVIHFVGPLWQLVLVRNGVRSWRTEPATKAT